LDTLFCSAFLFLKNNIEEASTVIVSKYANVEGAHIHYLIRTRRIGYTGKSLSGYKKKR